MQIHKFGGASLSTPAAVRHMADIIAPLATLDTTVLVVSAMGKTTNALEYALDIALNHPEKLEAATEPIRTYHLDIAHDLLSSSPMALEAIVRLLDDLEVLLHHLPEVPYDTLYDLVVPFGELLSSRIVHDYLATRLRATAWADARQMLRTNAQHRGATVLLPLSQPLARAALPPAQGLLYVTQGFIASTPQGATTTLGREGSDYTAALLATFLGADSLTIWKDVPGFLSADPKLFPGATRLPILDYREAIEMAYNGAKVIHPKALKPLQNAGIPLFVKSFNDPQAPGTRITHHEDSSPDGHQPPLIALLENQTLLSITPRDLSFALQDALPRIFDTLCAHNIQLHLIQNSAVSLSLCATHDAHNLQPAIEALQHDFHVSYNTDLVLLTIRRYPADVARLLSTHPGTLLYQTTRLTAQCLLRRNDWEQHLYPSISAATARNAAQRSTEM